MEELVFGCEDLRRYIFSFLRSKPDKACKECLKVLVWDKKVCDFVSTKRHYYFDIQKGDYCMSCYFKKVNIRCIISYVPGTFILQLLIS